MLSAAHCLSLTAIGMANGLAALWVFARLSDQKRIEIAKRKLRAHLYAFRLFVDEPALIFRAQKQLLIWNGRYLALVLVPAIVIGIPTFVLLMQLDAVYGRRTLAAGESAIVTVRFDTATDLRLISPMLEGRGVDVETPPVRIASEHQVSWRVRAASDASGSVLLRVPETSASKTVQVGPGLRYLSARRVASLVDWLRYPGEARLPAGDVQWIEVSYPDAKIYIFGVGMHWLLWFSIVCLITMLLFRRRFGVTF
jgi:hypothetical protein